MKNDKEKIEQILSLLEKGSECFCEARQKLNAFINEEPKSIDALAFAAVAKLGRDHRLLHVGEVLEPSDEVLLTGGWRRVVTPGVTVIYGYFRRALPKVPPSLIDEATYDTVHGITIRPVDPEEGYRLLARHETVQPGDAIRISGEWWVPAGNVGGRAFDSGPYRRKLPDLAKGYRYLRVGETLEQSDEFPWGSGWELTYREGEQVGFCDVYRRRIAPEQTAPEPTIGNGCADSADPDPGYGYRLLGPEERLEAGDEIWNTYTREWKVTCRTPGLRAFQSPFEDTVYRRCVAPPKPAMPSIDPGQGYRLLKFDEIIQPGDECFCGSFFSHWRPAAAIGMTVYSQLLGGLVAAYRRKIEDDVKPCCPQYRILNPEEPLREGDEFLSPAAYEDDCVEWLPALDPQRAGLLYRRRIV